MTRMRREDRPADDGSRAPLRIARRPKGERVEGDQLERSTDEQAADGVTEQRPGEFCQGMSNAAMPRQRSLP